MKKFNQFHSPGSKSESRTRYRQSVFCLVGALLSAVIFCGNPACANLDLADAPLSALVKSPPANIMFVLDDSQSMTCEVLMPTESNGFFPKFNENNDQIGAYCYIYDNLGGNVYYDSRRAMDIESRKYWKSRHFADNILYYNPNIIYEPWTSYDGQSFSSANMSNPKSHPLIPNAGTLNLDDVSYTVALAIDETSQTLLNVKNAHFFVSPHGNDPYLVTIDRDALTYYKVVGVDGIGLAQVVTKVEEAASLPHGIITDTVVDHRQNFANWFTYHRRREYVAKAAIGKTIDNLQGVRVGLLGINGKVLVPLKPVAAKINDQMMDEKSSVLDALYTYESTGFGTPLREGLNYVGRYYESNSIDLVAYGGIKISGDNPPFFTETEDGACQQCFAIVMTDGYYNYSSAQPKYRAIESAADRVIGNADGPNNLTEFDRKALQDDLSNTLADVAMYYYENDLQPENQNAANPGLPDRVPAHGFDNAPHQHMVTYGVTFGVALAGITRSDYNIYRIFNDIDYRVPWPVDIAAKTSETITDLWHGTLNSRGDFLTTQDHKHLSEALLEVTETTTKKLTGSAAAVSFNSTLLRADNQDATYMFQSSFSNENNADSWVGDVKAYRFKLEIGQFDIDSKPVWSAAEQLQAKPWDERKIATYNPYDHTGEVFIYDNLTDKQKAALGWDGVSGSEAETTAQKRVAYLKGKEIDGFRSRSNKLGDIVHSEPVHENNVIYVGANDGMLHAFNIGVSETQSLNNLSAGEELFAYIPNLIFENLDELTRPDYKHLFFVDLTPTIAKGMGLLEGKSPSNADGSQSVLVGGLRKGGRGYFAIDISDPFAMNTAGEVAQKVLWEFSDSDMGYSFSQPVVVRSYDADHPWIVMFGNGYGSTSGKAAFYIIDPVRKPGDIGFIVKKFNLAGSLADPNGLSSPTAVDVNFDNVVDYVYAGDLQGNLWKFDLTADNSSVWAVAYNSGSAIAPLFQARGPKSPDFPMGSPQPITTKPEVTFHPSTPGYLVMFGTGKFTGASDFSDNSVQSVYGIWDFGDDTDDSEYLGAAVRDGSGAISGLTNLSTKASLLRQESTDFIYTLPNFKTVDVRILSRYQVIWQTEIDADSGEYPNPSTAEENHVGWYFDLAARERVVTDVVLRENKLNIIGFRPDPYQCQPDAGNSWFMKIDAFNGGNLSTIQLDITGGGTLNDNDLIRLNPTDDLVPPAGIGFRGKLERASLLKIDSSIRLPVSAEEGDGIEVPDENRSTCAEQKYISSSTGEVRTICQKSINLGMVYWQEVQRN